MLKNKTERVIVFVSNFTPRFDTNTITCSVSISQFFIDTFNNRGGQKTSFYLLRFLSSFLKKLRKPLLKIDLAISQHAELRLIYLYDMLYSIYRWTFCIIKVSSSSWGTRVMSILKVCLLLPTLVNKS